MSDSALGLLLLVGLAGCAAQNQPPPRDNAGAPPPVAADQQASQDAAAGRQIIHRATLVLRVEDFGQTERKVAELVKASGGFVAEFHEDRSSGAQRGGRWTIRVPVPQFTRFVDQAGQLGVADQRETKADDVTEEYVDLGARLKNKQQLESRLLELVAKRGDDIKDVLALEAELARVREEIERMQGRLRSMVDRIALTTIQLTAYERLDYQPPLAATFPDRIRQTFSDSLTALRQCGEAWVLFVVALSPWLIAMFLLLGPLVWWARRRSRRPRAIVAQAV
jgi:hypothetical protein